MVVTSVGIVAALALGALVLLPGGNGGEPGPGGGSGSTISLGSTLHGEGGTFPCYGPVLNPCTLVQTALPDRETVAPLDGVVVRWRVRFADGDMRLVVVSGGGRKKVEAKTRAESVAEPVARFESRVPIKRGELIGLTLLPGAHTGFKFVDTPGARLERFPPLGETPREPDNAGTSESRHTELLLSAVVEPDEDGDRFGDVTQDRCPDEQGGDGGCP